MNGGFLFDTNILSELMRPRPEPKVQNWVAAQDLGALFLSVVTRNVKDFAGLGVVLLKPWDEV